MEIGSNSEDYKQTELSTKIFDRAPMMKHIEDYWEMDAQIYGTPFVATDKSELIERTKQHNMEVRDIFDLSKAERKNNKK